MCLRCFRLWILHGTLLGFKQLLPLFDLRLVTPFFAGFFLALVAAAGAELGVTFCFVISDFLPVPAFDGLPVLPELMIGIPQCFAGAIGAEPVQGSLFPVCLHIGGTWRDAVLFIPFQQYGLLSGVQPGQLIGCGGVDGILFEQIQKRRDQFFLNDLHPCQLCAGNLQLLCLDVPEFTRKLDALGLEFHQDLFEPHRCFHLFHIGELPCGGVGLDQHHLLHGLRHRRQNNTWSHLPS